MKTTRRQFVQGLSLGLGAASLPGLSLAQASGKTYRFSPVNQYGIELTASYWNPIIDYISRKAGVKLELKIGRTSADTTAYVLANEVEFIFSNHMFAPEREALGWRVFGRRNTAPIHGVVVVLADSPYKRLEDLAEQPVGFPGPEATVAYKFTYAQMLERKVPVQVVFGGNMDGAFAQLASGRVKAVGANSQLADGWSKREGKALRELWRSEPVYDLPLMAAKSVPDRDFQAVRAAFAGMAKDPEGRSILSVSDKLVKLDTDTVFIASDGSEYAAYRSFFKTAPAQLR